MFEMSVPNMWPTLLAEGNSNIRLACCRNRQNGKQYRKDPFNVQSSNKSMHTRFMTYHNQKQKEGKIPALSENQIKKPSLQDPILGQSDTNICINSISNVIIFNITVILKIKSTKHNYMVISDRTVAYIQFKMLKWIKVT